MTVTRRVSSQDHRLRQLAGPEIGFIAAVLITFVSWTVSLKAVASDLVMPGLMATFLLFACVFAAIGLRQRNADPRRPTYWDIAGALTFIGICASATIDPDQMVRLVEGAPRKP
jgi:asparagine N-glycosylation enzyme membrane subunit Stt3